nr:MAG TPA: hypothetical protein [Caudoviricetes sp.]
MTPFLMCRKVSYVWRHMQIKIITYGTINVKYFYHTRFSRMVRVFVESSKRLNCYSPTLKYFLGVIYYGN